MLSQVKPIKIGGAFADYGRSANFVSIFTRYFLSRTFWVIAHE